MLISPSIDTLEEKIENSAVIAILAARRAKDLLQGKLSITEEADINPVSQAAKEIAEGLINVKIDEEGATEGDGEKDFEK